MLPVATLTLKKQMVRGAQCPNGFKEDSEDNSIDPVVFDANDLTNPIRRNQMMAMDSPNLAKKPRNKGKQMKIIGKY